MKIENNSRIKNVPVPKASGYPNNVKNTQNAEIRGTGAATRGTKFNNSVG